MIPSGLQNLSLYDNDSQIPIAKVLYTNSPYGVDSLGYAVEYYNNSDGDSSWTFSSSNLVLRGHDNILSYDWGYGVPPGVMSTYFKSRYYGYFYAKFTGDYRFLVSTDPSNKVQFYIGDTSPETVNASGIFDSSEYCYVENMSDTGTSWSLGSGGNNETWYQSVRLTGGTWYAWGLQFINSQDNAYLSLRYIEPASVLDDNNYPSDHDPFYRSGHSNIWGWISSDEPVYHLKKTFYPKIMSAGITNYHRDWVNCGDACFETQQQIQSVIKIDGSHDYDKSSVFAFHVPINSDTITNSGADGFTINPNNGLYYEQASNITLRHNRKTCIYLGYQSKCNYAGGSSCDNSNDNITGFYCTLCENGGNTSCPANVPLDSDYVLCFNGVITDIDPSLSKDTNTLRITCQDQMLYMLKDINENYPNNISYANADFISSRKSREPNGLTRPTAYDGWLLSSVIRDLGAKSGIDPIWLYGRKQLINASGDIVYGSYLIDDHDLVLRRNSNYGNPLLTNENESDDKYLWSFNYGDSPHSIATEIVDTYGYSFKINSDGYLECGPVDSPVIHVPDWQYDGLHEVSGGSWITNNEWLAQVDSRADGGRYYECSMPDSPLIRRVTGSRFQVGMIRNTDVHSWNNIDAHRDATETDNHRMCIYDYTMSGEGDVLGPVTVYQTLKDWMHVFDVNRTVSVNNMYVRINKLDGVNKYNDGLIHITKHNLINVKWYFYSVPDASYLSSATAANIFENTESEFTLHDEGTLTLPDAPYSNIDDYIFIIPFTSSPILTGGSIYAIKFTQDDTDITVGPTWPGETWNCVSPIHAREQETSSPAIAHTSISRTINNVISNGSITETTTGYDKSPFSGATYWDLWCDGYTEYESVHSNCIINLYRDHSNELVTSIEVANTYDGYTQHSNGLRYPRDDTDYSGKNPCLIEIQSSILQSGDYEGIVQSYDRYRFEILHSGDDGSIPTRITSIRAYETDIASPIRYFDTYKNIIQLESKSSMEDMRNDIVVIGNLKGVVEDIDGRIINRNNPTYDYIYSRAIDVASVYYPHSQDGIGRKMPFTIVESAISDQRHADWLAQAVLYKYHSLRKNPSWESVGHTFVEPNDAINISDISNNTMYGSEQQWLLSCKHSFENGKYFNTFSSTPYRPWSSYTPRPRANIDDFLNYLGVPQPFINIRMTTTENNYCGSNLTGFEALDVYLVEESGLKLRIKYDQIIDGFVTAKVYKKNVNMPVAWLVGYVDENGMEHDQYRERGYDYELFWDCTDETAASKINYYLTTGEEWKYIDNFKTEQGLYATSGDYYVVLEIAPIEQNEGLDEESDRYRVDTRSLDAVLNANGAEYFESVSSNEYSQYWNITWGEPTYADMVVERQKDDGNYETCTYPHMVADGNYGLGFNAFNSERGIKIRFQFYNSEPRLVSFKVDGQVIRGTAIQSPLLYYDVYNYVLGMWYGYLMSKFGNSSLLHHGFGFTPKSPPGTDYTGIVAYYDEATMRAGLYYDLYTQYGAGQVPEDNRAAFLKLHSNIYGDRALSQPYYNTIRQYSVESEIEENKSILSCMDKFSKFEVISVGGSPRGRITFWSKDNMPYKSHMIEDYISPFTKKISSLGDIEFTYNPNRIVQNEIDVFKTPLMDDIERERFKQSIATMIWIATLNKKHDGTQWQWNNAISVTDSEDKPSIFTATYTQPIIRIWDKTGRYINSYEQVFNGELSHKHDSMTNCYNEGKHYTSVPFSNEFEHALAEGSSRITYYSSKFNLSSVGFDETENHTHPTLIEKCWIPSRQNYNTVPVEEFETEIPSTDSYDLIWKYDVDQGHRRDEPFPKNIYFLGLRRYRMYDMTVGGNGENYNWGIGQVNSDAYGMRPGAFTWHAYLLLSPGFGGHQLTNIPFDVSNTENTRHWCAFMPDDGSWQGKVLTHSRIAAACVPNSIDYTYENAAQNIKELFVTDYVANHGEIPTPYNGYSRGFDEVRQQFTESGYTPGSFHIHFPVMETMPYHDMNWMFYMQADDTNMLLRNEADPMAACWFYGETDSDWAIGVSCKYQAKIGVTYKVCYAGTTLRPPGDDWSFGGNDAYRNRGPAGIFKIHPMNHSTHYKHTLYGNSLGGYHYAWYKNELIQIPDWDIPADLSTWDRIPNVSDFGISWGL